MKWLGSLLVTILVVFCEKVDNRVAEVVIETAPREYIMDCMVHLQASEEYCKNNWFSKE